MSPSQLLRALPAVVLVALAAAAAHGQPPDRSSGRPESARVVRVREELRALVAAANAALARRDTAALKDFFAEEFIWAHAVGYINDRAAHLADELAVDSAVPLRPVLDPPAELRLYGDVAMLRTLFKSQGPLLLGRNALNTWVFAKDRGRWKVVQIQGTLLQPERPATSVPTALLEAYAGTYAGSGPGALIVERTPGGLVSRRSPSSVPPRVLAPTSDSTFVDKLGNEYVFHREAGGRGTRLVIRRYLGAESRFERRP